MMFRTSKLQVERILPAKEMQSQASEKRVANKKAKNSHKQVCPISDRYMYAHVTGLHGDQRCKHLGIYKGNDNGDFFEWRRTLLAKLDNDRFAYQTWIKGDVLENHDESQVFGYIPDVWPIMGRKAIDMLLATDREEAPHICKALERGSVTDVSMGTIVGYSFCSVPGCHRHASKNDPNIIEEDWCDHLKHLKGSYDNTHGLYIYENNRKIIGLECSWITEGVGADSDAVHKMTIASNKNFEEMSHKISEAQIMHRDEVMDLSIIDLWDDLVHAKRWV